MSHAVSHAIEDVPKPKPTGPCVMVIFGATGDLTSRKLIPALYNLLKLGMMSEQFAIVGTGRDDYSQDKYLAMMTDRLSRFATSDLEDNKLEWLVSRICYCAGSFGDPKLYQTIAGT